VIVLYGATTGIDVLCYLHDKYKLIYI